MACRILVGMTPEEIAKIQEEKGKRAVFYYEGAKRSVLAAEVLLKRLEKELTELEPVFHEPNIADRFGPVLITAMGIVDFAHRFGQLMDGMPLLKKSLKGASVQKLQQALVPVNEIRNHLQHLRTELAAGPEINYPLMGSVTWVRDKQCFAAALLTQGFEVEFPSMAFGAFGIGYLARYQYTVASQSVPLDHLVATMRDCFNWLASIFSFSDPDYDKTGWGHALVFTSSMSVEVTLNEKAANKSS